MKKTALLLPFLFLFSIMFILPHLDLGAQTGENSDKGYMFLGPRETIQTKRIKKDRRIRAFTRDGVIITENQASPWYNASCFAHGSVILDEENQVLTEILICQATDSNGDISWSVLWYPDGEKGEGSFELIQGIGKWAGIGGSGSTSGSRALRSDASIMPEYKISWEIDPVNAPFTDIIEDKEKYSFTDQCLSFHGPHIFLEKSALENGISLEFSSQSGVLMSMLGPETVSPRNGATCFDRGTTVKLDGKTQGDIMLLEDTDAEGDVAWLYHIWWYNKGPGIYQFVGGSGKWEGISGKGVTRGMFEGRSDDHFMLKSELYWNLPL